MPKNADCWLNSFEKKRPTAWKAKNSQVWSKHVRKLCQKKQLLQKIVTSLFLVRRLHQLSLEISKIMDCLLNSLAKSRHTAWKAKIAQYGLQMLGNFRETLSPVQLSEKNAKCLFSNVHQCWVMDKLLYEAKSQLTVSSKQSLMVGLKSPSLSCNAWSAWKDRV